MTDTDEPRITPVAQFDPSVPSIARVYDFFLGGKDNISQEVSGLPYSGLPVAIQARHHDYSKTAPFAVR